MNTELSNIIEKYIKEDNLSKAISILEIELKKYPQTKFHIIENLDLLHLKQDLEIYIEHFIEKNRKVDFKAIYCEINGFIINHDLWYLNFHAYDFIEPIGDSIPVWLGKSTVTSDYRTPFIITGYENLQDIFREYMDKELWEDSQLEKVADICSYLILLRLQELFKEAIKNGIFHNKKSGEIPILVTAHDYHHKFIYRIN